MYNDDTIMPGENIGETYPNTSGETDPASRAAAWENEMEGVEEFSMDRVFEDYSAPTPEDSLPPEQFNQESTPDQQVADASLLAGYGFNAACRQYDLKTVLTKIYNTDLTSGDAAFNPLGKIYEEIEPRPEARAYLFREIQKDAALDRDQDNDPSTDTSHSPLGMTPYGDFYDKRRPHDGYEQTSLDAILAMRKLLDALAIEPRFKPLRQRAEQEGKSIIDLLVGDTVDPTITTFLSGVNGELSSGSVEEILDEIATDESINADNLEDEETAPAGDAKGMLGFAANDAEDAELAPDSDALIFDTDVDLPPEFSAGSESSGDDITDTILAKFNQANDISGRSASSNSEFLTDSEFNDILRDESRINVPTSEFDSEEIVNRLKGQIPLDYEEAAKLAKARKTGDFPIDQAA